MTNENDLSVEVTVKYLNALCKAAGLHIDPETAEVEWIYAQTTRLVCKCGVCGGRV